jgi:sirohydrochlorin cobaltochelatase
VSLEADSAELQHLEDRINALLPPRYVGCFEDVSPTSMGSAKMRYDAQGRVAWGEIWTTFCHLALAGGPPHRGRLLMPVTQAEVEASPEAQQVVVAELERALRLTVDLPLVAERCPGWVGLRCDDAAMAAWLTRAVMAENVFARREGELLFVPVGPSFRIEKEVKNVVVSVAKSCHYLLGHVDDDARPTGDGPTLIAPPLPEEIEHARNAYDAAAMQLRAVIESTTTLPTLPDDYPGWLGLDCATENAAVWMLRAVAVEDVLVRREECRLYVPVSRDPSLPQAIDKTAVAVVQAYRLWTLKNAAT